MSNQIYILLFSAVVLLGVGIWFYFKKKDKSKGIVAFVISICFFIIFFGGLYYPSDK